MISRLFVIQRFFDPKKKSNGALGHLEITARPFKFSIRGKLMPVRSSELLWGAVEITLFRFTVCC
jgi:hypothetical protein